MSRIHIHAGGPRTGSSAFQHYLGLNAGAIRAQGVDLTYPDRDGAAGGRLRLWMPAPRHDAETVAWRKIKARDNLALESRKSSRPLIISEENIAGRMNPFFAGQFFPTVRERCAFLADVLAGHMVDNLLVLVRPYEALFLSAFRKRAEEHDVGHFADIRAQMAGFTGGWVEVITAYRDILRPRTLIVLPYTRDRCESDLLRLLAPRLSLDGFQDPAAGVNASLSDAALSALQERYRAGQRTDRAVVEAMREKFRDTRSDDAFAAFTAAQSGILAARYAEDIEVLQRMDDVKWGGTVAA